MPRGDGVSQGEDGMSMTKKEKAAFEALLTRAALRATSPVIPDVPPPDHSTNGLATGFLFIAPSSPYARVDIACSSSIHHAVGYTDKTTSQGARSLYSTRLMALRALRYEVEQECASRLRKVDQMIEAEEGA
jgi:hypothetical protein